MNDDELIREIATKAFCDALEARSQELAEDIARRMRAALQPQVVRRERTTALRDGSLLIAGSRSQTETLETLLAASSAISDGCGLLILRGAQAAGWNCNGLTGLDNFKHAILDCSHGVAAKVIASCSAAEVRASELDHIFAAKIGLDGAAKVALIPVLLKGHVAALLLALAPEGDEAAALEVLVQVAQLALDVQAYRKAALTRPAIQEQNHTAQTEIQNHLATRPVAAEVETPHTQAAAEAAPPAPEHEQVHTAEIPAAEPEATPVEHEQVTDTPEHVHMAEESAVAEAEQVAETQVPEAEHVVEAPVAEHEQAAESAVAEATQVAEAHIPEAEQVPAVVTSWQDEAAKALGHEPEAEVEASAPSKIEAEPEHETVEVSAEAEVTPETAAVPEAVVVPEVQQPVPEAAYAAVEVTPVAEPEVHVPQPEAAVVAPPFTAPVFHASAAAPQPAPTSQVPDEAHLKARRFAKLLVEEIKLYNQNKVAEGRARGDLYFRLREDIEKSRAAYHKRYGESVRDVDYFSQELLRILADNNLSVMGAGFPG